MGATYDSSDGRDAPIDRLSPNDLTALVTDRGPAPMNIAAVLVVDDGARLAADEVIRLLAERVPRVPRLRQRVRHAPPFCGRPYWVPDEGFDLRRHVGVHEVDGMPGLLDLVSTQVCRPLPRQMPLWRAHWVTGLGDDRAALVIVAHHVLADGLGGLAVIAALTDPLPTAAPHDTPSTGVLQPPGAAQPRTHDLAVDAWRARLHAWGRVRQRGRLAVQGLRDLGVGAHRPRRVARTSLNRPTGPRRRLSTLEVPLPRVVDAAHRHGCTVNDVIVAAAVGALTDVLLDRGERVESLVVSVPFSSRRSARATDLGNENGVVPFRVPGAGAEPLGRLRAVNAQSRVQRTRPRAASAGPLGVVFRGLARIGVFRWFIEHQRLVSTFVTNLRGPAEPLRFGGCRVSRIIPVAVTPGNTTVTFDVLSYAGCLGITVVADPDAVHDEPRLTERLSARLDELL